MQKYFHPNVLPLLLALNFNAAGLTSAYGLVHTRECRSMYDGKFFDSGRKLSFDDATEFCDNINGKLPMPLQASWQDSLEYMKMKASQRNEENWIGIIFKKEQNSKIIAYDYRKRALKDAQIRQFKSNVSSALQTMTIHETQCVVFVSTSENLRQNWHFHLQACNKEGVVPVANTICVCAMEMRATNLPIDSAEHIDTNLSTMVVKYEFSTPPRVSARTNRADVGEELLKESSYQKKTSTTLAIFLSVMGTCCLLGAAYCFIKKKGFINLMISRTRNEPDVESDSVSNEHTFPETATEQRLLHIYEEIIPQNAEPDSRPELPNDQPESWQDSLNPGFPINTKPSLEIPNLSSGCSSLCKDRRKSHEDDYLEPIFCLRSASTENIEMTTPDQKQTKAGCIPKLSYQKTIQYASVETVKYGKTGFDEEYFVDDTGSCCSSDEGDASSNIFLSGNCGISMKYKRHISSQSEKDAVSTSAEASTSHIEEHAYENECATASSTKADSNINAGLQLRKSSGFPVLNEPVIYTKVSTVPNEALYAKVNTRLKAKQNEKRQSGFSESFEAFVDDTSLNRNQTASANLEMTNDVER